MKKNLYAIIVLISIIFLSTQITALENNTKNLKKFEYDIIFVDKNNTIGPWDGTIHNPYQKINDAISNSENKDIIYILGGEYKESIIIDKEIALIGEDQNKTIINANNQEFGLKILTDNVLIKDLTIKNTSGFTDDSGIIIESNNCEINHCTFYRTKKGVFCNDSKNLKIKNSTFHTNGGGILIKESKEILIENIQACHNGIGINLEKSEDINIDKVFIHTNGIGIFVYKTKRCNIKNSNISNNNDNQGGIFIRNSEDIQIYKCNLFHNGFSIKISNSKNIKTSYSNIYYTTHFAFYIRGSEENIIIEKSEIANNLRYGIICFKCKIKLLNNNFYNNYLHSVKAEEESNIDAENNWWGSFFGPSLFLRMKGGKINYKAFKTKFFPWKIKKIEKIGNNQSLIFNEINIPNDIHPQINFNELDNDSDGCPNWWETKWDYDPYVYDDHKTLDPDNDGLSNIEECYTDKWDSNPFHRDLFIEFDYEKPKNPSKINKPPKKQLDLMIKAFEEQDIKVHIDDGSLGCGEEIPYISNFTFSKLIDLYWDYFLHNDLDNPRKGIFHYGLICEKGPGAGFAFIGWDCLDSFCISAEILEENFRLYSRGRLIVTGSMHETGHTLGLLSDDFNGNDNIGATDPFLRELWIFRNYKSTMNYLYTWSIMDYSDGTNGRVDFDDWGNLDFYFFKDTHFEWPKT